MQIQEGYTCYASSTVIHKYLIGRTLPLPCTVSLQFACPECRLIITILPQNSRFLCDEFQFVHVFVFRPLADALNIGCIQSSRQIPNVRCFAVTSGIVDSILK